MPVYLRYLNVLLKSQLQYRSSFWMIVLGQCLAPFSVFAGLYLLFARFGQLRGWTLPEVALTFAVTGMAYGLAECFARGFDSFASLVRGGDFDRLLVRPRGTVLQVFGSQFEFTRVGRLVQNALVLAWAVSRLPVEWTVVKGVTVALMIAGGVAIFVGIFILTATLSFWTLQGLELANILTDGGREVTQYPLTIYTKWVTVLFTYIIPFGCVNYLPLQYILGHSTNGFYLLTPLAGGLFLVPGLLVWRLGVRHYRSTGS